MELALLAKTLILCCKWHFLIFILYSSRYLYYYIVVRYIENRLRAVSIFSWSVEQNARHTLITTHLTKGEAQSLRARALPSLNLKKKRDCSRSMLKTTRTKIKPPCATTPLKQSSIQNIKIFPVRAFQLQPLVNDHLQWGTATTCNPLNPKVKIQIFVCFPHTFLVEL